MEELLKKRLKEDFESRCHKNPSYSLRAFARDMGVHHSNLSRFLAGKRALSKSTSLKLCNKLGICPTELKSFLADSKIDDRHLIQAAQFKFMSKWYFDAILEIALLPDFNFSADTIAKKLLLDVEVVEEAIQTLLKLGLLYIKDGKYCLTHKNSTNLLDVNTTSRAHRLYQESVIDISLNSLKTVDREARDHTSTTLAIAAEDIPHVKQIIKKFRMELNEYLQREDATPNAVYQLQVSFFPLTKEQKRTC